MNMGGVGGFGGAKVALFIGEALAVILRDDRPDLPFPGCWDFPGGGREGDESPFDCVERETGEELGLTLSRAQIRWRRPFMRGGVTNWFFVAGLPARAAQEIVFGTEGQGWRLMTPQQFLGQDRAIPQLQARLRLALSELDG